MLILKFIHYDNANGFAAVFSSFSTQSSLAGTTLQCHLCLVPNVIENREMN